MFLVKIEKITHKDGTDRLDGRYPLRIGRIATIHNLNVDEVVFIEYSPNKDDDYKGVLRTSLLQKYEVSKDYVIIETLNSVYHLKRIYI